MKNGSLLQPHAATITPSDKLDFSETVGYSSPAAVKIKVENTGANDLYASYKLKGTSPSAFALTTPAAMANAIASDGSINLEVKPAAGLTEGTYNAVLDVFVSTDAAIAGTETTSVTNAVTQASINLKLDVSTGEKLKIFTPPTFAMTYGTTFGGATVTNRGSVKGVTTDQELINNGAWSFADTVSIPDAGTTTTAVTFTLTNQVVGGVTYEASITTNAAVTVAKADQAPVALTTASVLLAKDTTGTVSPVAQGQGLATYHSGDTSVIEINASTGAVTAAGIGKANITVSYDGGTNYKPVTSAVLELTVYGAPGTPVVKAAGGDQKIDVSYTAEANNSQITQYQITLTGTRNDGAPVDEITHYILKFTSGGAVETVTGAAASLFDDVFTSGGAAYVTYNGVAYPNATTEAAVKTVQKTTTTALVVTEAGLTHSFSNVGLINGETYNISVVASNAGGNSAAGTTTAIPNKTATPDRPSGGGGGGGGGSVSTYTVTYDAGDHGKIDKKTETVSNGNSPKGVTVTADEGWKFVGWSLNGRTVIDLKDIKVTDSMTLKAVYKEAGEETVSISKGFNKDWISAYISGYPDGSFRADMGTTRAEVASMIAKILKDDMGSKSYSSDYSDLSGHWAANSIGFLSELGVVSGYPNGTFQPDKEITRAEFVTIVMRVDGLVDGDKSFSDVAGSYWAKQYILAAAEKEYVDGYKDGTFRPENAITRAEAVSILNAVLNWSAEKAGSGKTFTDLTSAHWSYDQVMKAANGVLR